MELTIAEIEKKEDFVDAHGEYKDIEDWPGVYFDDEGKVEKINFFTKNYKGTITFEWIPEFVKEINFHCNYFEGTIQTNPSSKMVTFPW